MNLDEWIALTATERNQFRREWGRKDDSWFGLIQEACNRFRIKFGHLSNINSVRDSFGFESEPSILVVTALHSPQIIEELPDRYCTFRVVQHQAEDTKDYYLKCWTQALHHLLGWTDEMVTSWALTHNSDGLNGIDGFFTHEEPDYYITRLLIPNTLFTGLRGQEKMRLESELFNALKQNGDSGYSISHFDWEAAKQRVQAVISKYQGYVE
jgi:hypothetical protein